MGSARIAGLGDTIMTFKTSIIAASIGLLGLAQTAQAEDLVFDLVNRSSYDVIEFYASPVNVHSWEEDILGRDILESGYTVQITIADGRRSCEYDLRFVFDDGDVLERGGVDLCETHRYTLTD